MAKYSREELKDLVKEKLSEGMTVEEIARKLRLSEATILNVKNQLTGRYPWGTTKA